MNVLMMVPHADLVRDLLDLAIAWSVATLSWVAPAVSIGAIAWKTSSAIERRLLPSDGRPALRS